MRLLPLCSVIALSIVAVVPVAQADEESARQALMACVHKTLPKERAKPKSSIDALIRTCKKEYDAFVATLPADWVSDIMGEFRKQITEALSEKAQ